MVKEGLLGLSTTTIAIFSIMFSNTLRISLNDVHLKRKNITGEMQISDVAG